MSVDLLDELHKGGTYHSSGTWSQAISSDRTGHGALFSAPEACLLKLVQCAHACASSECTVRTSGRRLEVSFQAAGLDGDALQAMVGDLSVMAGSRATSPAGLVVAAVRAARDAGLESVRWGAGSWGLVLTGDQITLHRLDRARLGGGFFFAVEAPEGNSSFWKRATPWSAELERARERCCFASLPITCNGKVWAPYFPVATPAVQGVPWLCDRVYWEGPSEAERDALRGDLLTLPHGPAWGALVYDFGRRPANLQVLGGQGFAYLQQWRGYLGNEFEGRDLYPRFRMGHVTTHSETDLSRVSSDAIILKGEAAGTFRAGKLQYAQSDSSIARSAYSFPALGSVLRPSLRARCLVRIPAQPAGKPSRLTWVQLGVCLEASPAKLLMSDLHVYIADNLITTDLTGLKAVVDERWEATAEWLQLELMTTARELRQNLTDWKKHGLHKKFVIQVMEAQNLDVRDYEVYS